jgi:putative toxin-antitoxin system antitoxin component (TIGR02293 family)
VGRQAIRTEAAPRPGGRRPVDPYRKLYETQPADRIQIIKHGVKASEAKAWLSVPVIAMGVVLKALDLPVATFNRKVKANQRLSKAEGERVVGFARLVGQLEAMVDEAGDAKGFDARAWMSRWLTEPLPALGNAMPIDYMDTMEGQSLVSRTLAQVASGAYA